jgi:hypothetical protein
MALLKERPIGLGPCDLLSISEVAKVLRMREPDARAFCQEQGIIRYFAGRQRVAAGELMAAGARSKEMEATRRHAAAVPLKRIKLT